MNRSCEKRSVIYRVKKKKKNIVHTVNRRNANWIGHIWHRNCLITDVTEGKMAGRIEVTGTGRRRKQLLDDLTEEGTVN
jgi:hypothetical protein